MAATLQEYEAKIGELENANRELREHRMNKSKESVNNLKEILEELDEIEKMNDHLNQKLDQEKQLQQSLRDELTINKKLIDVLTDRVNDLEKEKQQPTPLPIVPQHNNVEIIQQPLELIEELKKLKEFSNEATKKLEDNKKTMDQIDQLTSQIRKLITVNESSEQSNNIKDVSTKTWRSTIKIKKEKESVETKKDNKPVQRKLEDISRSVTVATVRENLKIYFDTVSRPKVKQRQMLPEGWAYAKGNPDGAIFVNKITGEVSNVHPLFSFAQNPLNKPRSSHRQEVSESEIGNEENRATDETAGNPIKTFDSKGRYFWIICGISMVGMIFAAWMKLEKSNVK